jgi:hypothetical protein
MAIIGMKLPVPLLTDPFSLPGLEGRSKVKIILVFSFLSINEFLLYAWN